jgi:hypothetical protein
MKILETASYEEIVEMLNTMPMTWYPALMVTLVEAGYKKKVFLPSGASTIIQTLERKLGKANVEKENKVAGVDGDN